ncbi:hypothetical protein HHSLTHF2_30460 [Vreelandella venusta]|uniref:Uncharacterized protein n=1 Tax=Halomonas hydrothermalis TaxID=115561 RepID=A0A6F8U7Q8_9GAMM|nr:hypothetical protein HHSLTHF2_30460 [Halomonas hydrothermalis]
MRIVQGLFKHSDIELQMRKLAIEVELWVVKIRLQMRLFRVNSGGGTIDAQWQSLSLASYRFVCSVC